MLQNKKVKLIQDDLLKKQMNDALDAAQDAEVFILALYGLQGST